MCFNISPFILNWAFCRISQVPIPLMQHCRNFTYDTVALRLKLKTVFFECNTDVTEQCHTYITVALKTIHVLINLFSTILSYLSICLEFMTS